MQLLITPLLLPLSLFHLIIDSFCDIPDVPLVSYITVSFVYDAAISAGEKRIDPTDEHIIWLK